jgi:threonine synthase
VRYVSTRGRAPALDFPAAVEASLAPDGGLYVPEAFPRAPASYPEVGNRNGYLAALGGFAAEVLRPFLDAAPGAPDIGETARAALSFPIPLVDLGEGTAMLQLFHGPSAAFKDVGARFLAECVAHRPGGTGRALVLVATSGDTGGAVAAAFHGRPDVDVAILFPAGRISPRQRQQLTAWGGNVRAFAVRGTFDDCQRLVKAAFADEGLRARRRLLSANSINIGRLLPQQVYYAAAALDYRARHGADPGFIVPTGNLGNAVACLWAKRMGFPIRRVVLATNANKAIPEFFRTGTYAPFPTVATLANAMDVGNPSNAERLIHLYGSIEALKADVDAVGVNDDEIRDTIRRSERDWGRAVCPHTATALFARERLAEPHWIVVATAHPAKFETIVEPLVGHPLEVPPALQTLLGRPSHAEEIGPEDASLRAICS